MTDDSGFEWYVQWPDGQGGCLQALVRADDAEEAYLRARAKLIGQHPNLEPLLEGQPRVTRVAQA